MILRFGLLFSLLSTFFFPFLLLLPSYLLHIAITTTTCSLTFATRHSFSSPPSHVIFFFFLFLFFAPLFISFFFLHAQRCNMYVTHGPPR